MTQIDTYIECPFRFFAERVLRLEDEREDDPGLTPRERGELTHRIFQQFFERWAAAGRGAVTEGNLDDARRLFASVTDDALAGIAPADAATERARLLGSAISPAMGDRVLRHELERDAEVVERRLEEPLDGTYVFVDADGVECTIALRGKADRVDFLHDGHFDVVDYKTGRAPGGRAIQLPVYAHVAQQRFQGHRGRSWKARAADYVAFRGRAITHALGRSEKERDERLAEAQQQLVAAVGAIGRGEFPPRPAECGRARGVRTTASAARTTSVRSMRKGDSRQLSLFAAQAPADAGGEPRREGETTTETVDGVEPGAADVLPEPPDAEERAHAVNPAEHVVLEASAGTGKTSVLVQRYCNLLAAGVDPANILAITFTRKAAAEMRERILRELRRDALRSPAGRRRWLELRDRVGDIAISTIDAFCLSLLREFPLEADLAPAFRVAEDTEVARMTERALDLALRAGRAIAAEDEPVAQVLAEMSTRQLRAGLGHLLDRRSVALPALAGFLARSDAPTSAAVAVDTAIEALRRALADVAGGAAGFFDAGPAESSRFRLLRRDLQDALDGRLARGADRRRALEHVAEYSSRRKGSRGRNCRWPGGCSGTRTRSAGTGPPSRRSRPPSPRCSSGSTVTSTASWRAGSSASP